MCVFTTVATNNTFFIYIPLSAYQRLQPRLILQESEPFIPYKALLIVLSSVSYIAAMSCNATMSCAAALILHYALNCTIFDVTVAPLLMPDYPTRMSISATMWLSPSRSHPTCYLQDRDEIADDVIIAISPDTPKPLCKSHHSVGNIITVPSGINPRATVASIKVLFRSVKASN